MILCVDDTPLHQCVEHNLPDAVSALLAHGSDVNYRNSLGLSPLHLAVQVRNGEDLICTSSDEIVQRTSSDEIVYCLVKNGYNTDVNLPDVHGMIQFTQQSI